MKTKKRISRPKRTALNFKPLSNLADRLDRASEKTKLSKTAIMEIALEKELNSLGIN